MDELAREEARRTVRRLIETYVRLDQREVMSKTDMMVTYSFIELQRMKENIKLKDIFNFKSFYSQVEMIEFARKLMEALNKNNFINTISVDLKEKFNIIIENKLFKKRVTRSKYENDDENSDARTDDELQPDDLDSKADVADVLCKLHARLSLLEAQSGANVGPASRIR